MPKLGEFSYPSVKLDKAVEVASKICQPPYRGEITVDGLASELKMSKKGGGFSYLVSALRDYNLIRGRGKLQATELTKKIVTGTAEEVNRSKAQAFLSVGLFKRIYEKVGLSLPDKEQFSIVLSEITHADRLKVSEVAESIRRTYLDALPYLRSLEEEKREEREAEEEYRKPEAPPQPQVPTVLPLPEGAIGQLILPNLGQVIISDFDTLEIARQWLNIVEKRLGNKEKESIKQTALTEAQQGESQEKVKQVSLIESS